MLLWLPLRGSGSVNKLQSRSRQKESIRFMPIHGGKSNLFHDLNVKWHEQFPDPFYIVVRVCPIQKNPFL